MDRLFPKEMFHILLAKVVKDLKMDSSKQLDKEEGATAKPIPSSIKFLFLQGPVKPSEVPFPEPFKRIMFQEWTTPFRSRRAPREVSKFSMLPDTILELLNNPLMGAPVAALSTQSVLPSEGEDGPKYV